MKCWKILRDCRLKGDGVHHGMLGIDRLHNLNFAGQTAAATARDTLATSKIIYGTALGAWISLFSRLRRRPRRVR